MYMIQLKKWWKIGIILLISVLIVAYYLFLRKGDSKIDPVKSTEKLKEGLSEIKDRIVEVQNTAVVETAVAKTKVVAVKEELNDISKETDSIKRRTRLNDLANRVLED